MSSSGRKKYLTDLERNLERMEHIKRRITQCQSFGDEEKTNLMHSIQQVQRYMIRQSSHMDAVNALINIMVLKSTDKSYADMVVEWLSEIIQNVGPEDAHYAEVLFDLQDRARPGLANFFKDKREEA